MMKNLEETSQEAESRGTIFLLGDKNPLFGRRKKGHIHFMFFSSCFNSLKIVIRHT
jgi:hypothetical protein